MNADTNRRIFITLLTTLLIWLLPVHRAKADGFAIDTSRFAGPLSGLWTGENGVVVNAIQQFDNVFVTVLSFDADGNSVWYAAPSCAIGDNSNRCTGELVSLSGGTPATEVWNGENLKQRIVGRFFLIFEDENHLAMRLDIDHLHGEKMLSRVIFASAPRGKF